MLEIFGYVVHGLQIIASLYLLWLILWCVNAALKVVLDKHSIKLRNARYVKLQAALELKTLKESYEQRQTKS